MHLLTGYKQTFQMKSVLPSFVCPSVSKRPQFSVLLVRNVADGVMISSPRTFWTPANAVRDTRSLKASAWLLLCKGDRQGDAFLSGGVLLANT